MRRTRRWLIGLVLVGLGVWLGSRWLLTVLYPLDPYREMIFKRAQEHGLDPYLVAAVIRHESNFRPDATSYRGARGLMQILPETGGWIAQKMGLPFKPEMLYQPDYNIQLGCWYLAYQQQVFDGRVPPALAAYNGGQQNVKKWLAEARWNGNLETAEQIPFSETRTYVRRVMESYQRYRQIYAPRTGGLSRGQRHLQAAAGG